MEATHLPAADRFHFDWDVFAATSSYIADQREKARNGQQGAGVASMQEKQELAQQQNSRADQREAMEQAGMKAPSPEGQVSQMEEILEQREQARELAGWNESDPDAAGGEQGVNQHGR